MKVPLTEETAKPLVELLKSHDPEVQRASTLAISNFSISGPGKLGDSINLRSRSSGPASIMVRGSSLGVGGHGFHSRPHHTKDVKNGTSGYLAHG